MFTDLQDAYGQLLYAYYQGDPAMEIVERDDGHIDATHNLKSYFASFAEWPAIEQEAMQYAKGRVLDIGSGAGRVALHLQTKGCEVLCTDNSPLALEVCRLRGALHTSATPITRIDTSLGQFDTIVMLGNNFGLFGNRERAKRLLRRFHRLTSPGAHIIAESNDIYTTDRPEHLAYQERNRQRGRMSGQIRLRVRHQLYKTPWFDYLMVSPDEMESIVEGTGWHIDRLLRDPESPIYVAILAKDAS